nr:HEAT repeat domain-containing protein [Tissierella sp.]
MTVYTVYFSFILFVILLVIVNSYFLISLKIEKQKNDKIAKKKIEIKESLKEIFAKDTKNKETEIEGLKSLFDSKVDIEAFYLAVKEYKGEVKNKQEFIDVLEEVVDIDKIFKSGVVRKEYKRSYTLHLISDFEIGNKKAGDFAIESLDKDSVFIRNNALKVLNKNEDISYLIRALEKINDKKCFFNEKMIIDFLDEFNGEQKELRKVLHSNIRSYKTPLRKIIVSHFTNIKDGSEETRELILKIMDQCPEKEMIIAGLRYFSEVIDNRAKPYILDMMAHKDWAIRATSARAIYKYPDNIVKEKLKEGLKDVNYYVRYNSASSFLKLESKERVIEEAFENEDRFARDIILYTMNKEGMLSLEEYENLSEKITTYKDREGGVLI